MKEIRAITDAYQRIDFSKHHASLATVVRVEGSSYRRTGARMLVLDDGTYLGGISGGCLEGDALRRAQKAIASNTASIITYDTMQDDGQQIGVGLGCNGIIDVLFTPLHHNDANNPVKILCGLTATRIPSIIITITGCPVSLQALGKTCLYENDQQLTQIFPIKNIVKETLHDIKKAIDTHCSKTCTYTLSEGDVSTFIEVINPSMHLVIYGGNYDMYPLLRIAHELGWDTTVITNTTKADKSLLSLAATIIHNKAAEQPAIDDYTAVICMTHDYKNDFNNLQKILTTTAKYIGILGPRKRVEKMFNDMAAEGKNMSDADKSRIFSPAGLDIGANSPEEIALSIIAEIQSYFAGRKGTSLRLREGAIHE